MADLTAADFIVVGRFSKVDEKAVFLLNSMIKGNASAAQSRIQALLNSKPSLVVAAPDGRLSHHNYSQRLDGFGGSVDAEKVALWFLLGNEGSNRFEREPAELADGFKALVENRNPNLLFRLLQRVDFDMQRDALEELYAQPDTHLVAQLHETALSNDSELGYKALAVLTQTKLLDLDKLWDKWTSLPLMRAAAPLLMKRDAGRTMRELKNAISAEQNPPQLVSLLYEIPSGSPEKIDLALPHLGHSSAQVRDRVIGNIWDTLYNLNFKAFTSPDAKRELSLLGERLIPLLDERLKIETDQGCKRRLTTMLAREDGVPWILRIPREGLHPPIPPYSEDKELDFLINRLTSHSDHGFVVESAGREVAERFFDEGFKRLKAAAVATNMFNPENVIAGMGWVRHPKMFAYLVDHLATIGPGDRTYQSTFQALGVQNNPHSLAAIKRFSHEINENNTHQLNGLALLEHKETLSYLKSHESEIKYHAQVPYLRARAMHGDSWAETELLAALKAPPATKFLTDGFWIPPYIIEALLSIDTPAATEALKKNVERMWPVKRDANNFPFFWARLENYAGKSQRGSALAEVARRDPQWLAALALGRMADKALPARSHGADVFHQLTGHLGDYDPAAFASARVEPLKKLEVWWAEHKFESREQWLINYFRGKGFMIEKLDTHALPVLVRALESDFFTHNLAVEQISVICQKYFAEFRQQDSYQGQKQLNVRIVGWLRARGLIE